MAMDFIIGLLSYNCSAIMVVIDQLSKFAYFIALPANFTTKKVADAFIQHVVKIHGILAISNKLKKKKTHHKTYLT